MLEEGTGDERENEEDVEADDTLLPLPISSESLSCGDGVLVCTLPECVDCFVSIEGRLLVGMFKDVAFLVARMKTMKFYYPAFDYTIISIHESQ